MKTTAKELRELVVGNCEEMGRLSRAVLGTADYNELTVLYRDALDALTEWATADADHTSTKEHENKAFKAVKAVLEVFATGESRIIIDEKSMNSLRDRSTKPATAYSAEYRKANKALTRAKKVRKERAVDLITLGAPVRGEEETIESYIARVKDAKIETKAGEMDMLEMYTAADSVVIVKEKAVQAVKDAGGWRKRVAIAVDLRIFADLVENYIADCIEGNYNMKSSKTIREEKAAEREAAKAEK